MGAATCKVQVNIARRRTIFQSIYKLFKNNGAVLPRDDDSQRPRSQFHSATLLVLSFLGRSCNTFSDTGWCFVLLTISLVVTILFLEVSIDLGALAKKAGLDTKTSHMSQDVNTSQVIDKEILDRIGMLLKSIEGSFKSIQSS